MSALRVVSHTGDGLRRHLDDIARLRIEVFRSWPYLYAGDLDYERRYLQTYAATEDAMVAICFDGERVVGASTALPLAAETAEITAPFATGSGEGRGIRVGNTLYLGESVLEPAYRGHGIGVEFFAQREAHARALGLEHAVFCAVQRPDDHPLRPADYLPLDAFWRKRGYATLANCRTTLIWRDHGHADESAKPMQFWHKHLGG
jgi:GNAT superfamily N-acetyltransferase